MDTVLELLDRLESALRRHLAGLPGDRRKAMEDEILGLIRMARAALPRELHQASRLMEEASLSLARSREEARRIVLDAQAHARSLAEAGLARGCEAEGAALKEEARREAERIQRGADEYAATVLARLEAETERVLAAIRRGQEVLRSTGARSRGA